MVEKMKKENSKRDGYRVTNGTPNPHAVNYSGKGVRRDQEQICLSLSTEEKTAV